jgi:hypothetical protein
MRNINFSLRIHMSVAGIFLLGIFISPNVLVCAEPPAREHRID